MVSRTFTELQELYDRGNMTTLNIGVPPGTKLDRGKPRVGLMFKDFARALLKVAEVATLGAEKYSPSGWETVPDNGERYDDAKGRHLLLGYVEELDPETELSHLAHEAWNALCVLEIKLREDEASPDK